MFPSGLDRSSEQRFDLELVTLRERSALELARMTERTRCRDEYSLRINELFTNMQRRISECNNAMLGAFDGKGLEGAEAAMIQIERNLQNIRQSCDLENNELKKILEERLQNIDNIYGQKLRDLDSAHQQRLRDLGLGNAPATAPTPSPMAPRPITYITVKYDAGYGNSLWICGNGPKMSWDLEKAVPLRCVGRDTWVYETDQSFEVFQYKIVLNKKVWENVKSDRTLRKDTSHQFVPSFLR